MDREEKGANQRIWVWDDGEREVAGYLDMVSLFENLDPVVVTIIKGHLFLEAKLNAAIESRVAHPELLPKARLTSMQKVHLLRANSNKDPNAQAWTMLERLNALRNAVAHNLGSEFRRGAMQRLRESETEITHTDEARTVKLCVARCSGFVGSAIIPR